MNSDSVTPQNPQVLGTCPGYIMTEDSSCGRMFKRVLFPAPGFPNKTKFLESLVSQLGLHLPPDVGVWGCGCVVHMQCSVSAVSSYNSTNCAPTVLPNQIA